MAVAGGTMRFRLFAALAIMLAATCLAAAEPLELAVKSVNVAEDDVVAGQRQLRLALTAASAEAFARFSTEHVGRVVDLSIDGEVVASPRLVEPISGGLLVVGGMFEPGKVEEIARRLLDGTARLEVGVSATQ